MCLDDKIYEQAESKPNVIPLLLKDIESNFPELIKAKNNRELKEYYATLSPILPLFIFNRYDVDLLYYTDADIAFWSNPLKLNDIIGSHSIMVVDHGFEPPRANIRFNVGILGYRNDQYCKEFLNWWKQKCLEWCKWKTMPDGRFADQGYLNILHNSKQFKNVLEVNPIKSGVNLAPWNGGMCEINEGPKINGKTDVVCYHYHEFRLVNNDYYPTGWKLNKGFITHIYEPYFRLIKKYQAGKL